ncbi:MAG: hypothetical protein ACKPKO_16640, partial [Candidatus Fonsibacter sp.]
HNADVRATAVVAEVEAEEHLKNEYPADELQQDGSNIAALEEDWAGRLDCGAHVIEADSAAVWADYEGPQPPFPASAAT